MSARKFKKSWHADITYRGVRHRPRSPENSRAGAVAYEALLRKRLANGEDITQPEQERLRFKQFSQQWLDVYVRNNNKDSEQRTKESILRNHLTPFFGKYYLDEITSQAIEEYKARKRASGLAAKTVNNHLIILRRCLRVALEWGRIEKIPFMQPLKIEPPSIIFLTNEECSALLAVNEEPMARLMILTALHTGMRLGELCALKWEDISFERRTISVRHSVVRKVFGSTKSNKHRHIPMTSELAYTLQQAPQTSPFVFHLNGEIVSDYAAGEMLSRACERAKVRRVTWHKLRHTFASQLVSRGVPMRAVQVLMGHSTVQMTERYAHLAPSSLNEAIAVLEAPHVGILGNPWATEHTTVAVSNEISLPKLGVPSSK